MFLKMDTCTCHKMNNFAIICGKRGRVAKTMVAKDTEAHHTSEYHQSLVEKILQDDDFKKEHSLCIVTISASNMLSTVKLWHGDNDNDIKLEGFVRDINTFETEEQNEVAIEQQQNNDTLIDLLEAASELSQINYMCCVLLNCSC